MTDNVDKAGELDPRVQVELCRAVATRRGSIPNCRVRRCRRIGHCAGPFARGTLITDDQSHRYWLPICIARADFTEIEEFALEWALCRKTWPALRPADWKEQRRRYKLLEKNWPGGSWINTLPP